MGLFHVPFEDGEQVVEFAPAFPGFGRTFDALVGMLMDHDLGEGFERLACRNHLHQHLRAIAILFDHPLDRGELSADLAQPHSQSPLFRRGMLVVVGSHAARIVAGEQKSEDEK